MPGSWDIFAIVGLALAVILLAFIFLLPSERSPSQRRSVQWRREQPDETKDWKTTCLHLEKHIHGLREQQEKMKGRERFLERELAIQKQKARKIQDKMTQERGWQQKEEGEKERRGQEAVKLKEELQQLEDEVQKEHGERLRAEREFKESKDLLASMTTERRGLEARIAKLEAELDKALKDNKVLSVQNAKLSQQHDDATWIAKSEYIKLEQQLRNLEKDYQRFRDQLRREQS